MASLPRISPTIRYQEMAPAQEKPLVNEMPVDHEIATKDLGKQSPTSIVEPREEPDELDEEIANIFEQALYLNDQPQDRPQQRDTSHHVYTAERTFSPIESDQDTHENEASLADPIQDTREKAAGIERRIRKYHINKTPYERPKTKEKKK